MSAELAAISERLALLESTLKAGSICAITPNEAVRDIAAAMKVAMALRETLAVLMAQLAEARHQEARPKRRYYAVIDQTISQLLAGSFDDQARGIVKPGGMPA